MAENPLPIIAFAGYSGSGKTTLLTALVSELCRRGRRPALIKHAHCGFDMDRPGKDSHRLREAGAGQVMVVSEKRWALLVEAPAEGEIPLRERARAIDPAQSDLILAEGFRQAPVPKILVHRSGSGKPLPDWNDDHLLAVVTDAPETAPEGVPIFGLDEVPRLAGFLEEQLGKY